jgi:O-antigen ligase
VKETKMPAERVSDAHNMYLNLAVDGGIPSALAVTGLFLAAAWLALRFARHSPDERYFWVGVAVSALSLLFFGLAGDIFMVRYKFACVPWYLLGFALDRRAGEERAPTRETTDGPVSSFAEDES